MFTQQECQAIPYWFMPSWCSWSHVLKDIIWALALCVGRGKLRIVQKWIRANNVAQGYFVFALLSFGTKCFFLIIHFTFLYPVFVMTDPCLDKDWLQKSVKNSARQLTVYTDPASGEPWLHVLGEDGEEDSSATFCRVALKLANDIKYWATHSSVSPQRPSESPLPLGPPPGYILPMPASSSSLSSQYSLVQQYGRHCQLDPYGNPWETFPEIGRVLHCKNIIDISDSRIQSISDRLYPRSGAPPGFAQALQTQAQRGFRWYEMATHGAKRQGLLSSCSCCQPKKVMRISWSHESSDNHIFAMQQFLQAWIGLEFTTLDGSYCGTSNLPCVWQRDIFDGVHAETKKTYLATRSSQQCLQKPSGCAAWNSGRGCHMCDTMYGLKWSRCMSMHWPQTTIDSFKYACDHYVTAARSLKAVRAWKLDVYCGYMNSLLECKFLFFSQNCHNVAIRMRHQLWHA